MLIITAKIKKNQYTEDMDSTEGELLRQTYRPDLICFDTIIVELKALSATAGEHKAWVLNYLKATGKRVGLLVNFGSHPRATVERIIL